MTGINDRHDWLRAALMVAIGLGLLTLIVTLFVKESLPTALAMTLIVLLLALVLGAAFGGAYVPDGPPNSAIAAGRGDGTVLWVREFLPDDELATRMRRAIGTAVMWLAFAAWIPFYAVPIVRILSDMIADPDGQGEATEAGQILLSIGFGTILLAVFGVLAILLPRLTSNAHIRTLRQTRPHTEYVANKATVGLAQLARVTAPGTRVRAGGLLVSYVGVADTELSVWAASRGRLTHLISTPRESITRVDLGPVDLRFNEVPGVIVATTTLEQPLELAPVEHVLDHQESAERLRDRLSTYAERRPY